MDSEEAREIAHHAAIGKPQTDEGPYYHEPWWEAYKGTVKGLLGGLTIGAAVGGVMGAVTTGLLVAAGIPVGAQLIPIALSFSGLGAVLGAHEFSQVGTVTGAVAAAHEISEARMKEFEESRFADLKREIRGLRNFLTGGKDTPEIEKAMAECEPGTPTCAETDAKQQADYRTQHCDTGHCGEFKPVFWKVTLIGAGVGAAAGSLLGYSGLFGEMMHPLHGMIAPAQLPLATTLVGASLGATFGVNRDLFRRTFDVTDRMFKGFPTEGQGVEPALAHGAGLEHGPGHSKGGCAAEQSPERVLIEHAADADTVHVSHVKRLGRDKLTPETAMAALLKLDHNCSVRQ